MGATGSGPGSVVSRMALLGLVLGVPAPATVQAGLPFPTRTAIRLSDPPTECHYRFSAGTADVLTVWVTARTEFDVPIDDCPVTIGLTPIAGPGLSECCGTQSAITNSWGAAELHFRGLGGRGTLQLDVTLFCPAYYVLPPEVIEFTSTNLDGDENGLTNIFDAAVFAGSLGTAFPLAPPHLWANYDCDGDVDILDASYLATGLGLDCTVSCP